jgi:hypothetical protein
MKLAILAAAVHGKRRFEKSNHQVGKGDSKMRHDVYLRSKV